MANQHNENPNTVKTAVNTYLFMESFVRILNFRILKGPYRSSLALGNGYCLYLAFMLNLGKLNTFPFVLISTVVGASVNLA